MCRWVAAGIRPFSVVEDVAFLEYSNTLDPAFKVPSRNTIKRRVNAIYEQVCEDVKHEMKDNWQVFQAATSDVWTSMAGDAYISLTWHYIDQDF